MKTIEEMNISGKTVILRSDLNVPLKDGQVDDDSKIVKSIKTIKYIIEHNARVVILSHLGRVKEEADKVTNSLYIVAEYLQNKMQTEVHFIKKTKDANLKSEIDSYPLGSIIMLENTRFEDVPNKLESSNNQELAKYWASLGDVFCLDGFGSAHRAHASTAGIGSYIPYCLGLLVKEELSNLSYLATGPNRPFTILMGGAKVDDKLKLIESLLPKCDYFLATGGIANSFLKALGFPVGSSLATGDMEVILNLRKLMLNYRDKILLPLDATVGSTYDENYVKYRPTSQIGTNEIIYDIGIKTINKYKIAIDRSKTIFVNGTCGKYEDPKYANGTNQCFTNLSLSSADIYVGGGDSVAAAKKLGFESKFKYLSSGGGATLEYLADGKLQALEYLKENGYVENVNA
ncbi:MAG: phosphoglycerate kinase [Bacilli bacterium]|nr:phosphoglycerate kinase [Bacilli bacterium]